MLVWIIFPQAMLLFIFSAISRVPFICTILASFADRHLHLEWWCIETVPQFEEKLLRHLLSRAGNTETVG